MTEKPLSIYQRERQTDYCRKERGTGGGKTKNERERELTRQTDRRLCDCSVLRKSYQFTDHDSHTHTRTFCPYGNLETGRDAPIYRVFHPATTHRHTHHASHTTHSTLTHLSTTSLSLTHTHYPSHTKHDITDL